MDFLCRIVGFIDLEGIVLNFRRRCVSECFINFIDNMMYGSLFDSVEDYGGYLFFFIRIFIGEDVELFIGLDFILEMKKDFMER